MEIRHSPLALSRLKADGWVFFLWADDAIAWPSSDAVLRRLSRMAKAWIKTSGVRGDAGEIASFPTWETLPVRHILLVGLGRKKDFHVGALDKAAATAARKAEKLGLRSLVYAADSLPRAASMPAELIARTLALSARRAVYSVDKAPGASARRPVPSKLRAIIIASANANTAAMKAGLKQGDIIGSSINSVRDLANLPGNLASPSVVASWAAAMARRYGLGCAIWDEKKILLNKCDALYAVGRGSRNPPRLIILKYRGTHSRLRPVVLVGKTITFDTGGISLKPAEKMEWMKYDKSGGMAVLAAMMTIARLNIRRPVMAILAAAENMPGGNATRPGDVIRSRAGKSIEIVNTDAEGRLVLADALHVAQMFMPKAIVDLATLTGAAIRALGRVVSALMGSPESLVNQLRASGEATGDRVWPLPLYPEYAGMLSTPFADLKNVGDGTAGAIAGGMFLRTFVPPEIPWAHIDLTNAWEEKEQPHCAAGATLFGAALLSDWVKRLDQESP